MNDNVAPVAMWIGGLAAGLVGVVGFLALQRVVTRRAEVRGALSATDS